jgi:hypothetical protein
MVTVLLYCRCDGGLNNGSVTRELLLWVYLQCLVY